MDLKALNVELFQKLSLALAIIHQTPAGIQVDLFTRCLAKRLFPRISFVDESLLLRQENLLHRLSPPTNVSLTSSISLMDLSTWTTNEIKSNNEYEYGDFAEKVSQLKHRTSPIKLVDVEFFFSIIGKWLRKFDVNHRILPVDASLYTIQLITHHLQIENDKPFHLVFDLLPLIEKFLDALLDKIEQTADDNVVCLQSMIISFASANVCVSRLLDKIYLRLRQHCERPDDDEFHPYVSTIDPIDRLFNILHEIIHNRSFFQRRLSQRSIEKLTHFINQCIVLLDGKSNFHHILKLQGQCQAVHYYRIETSSKTLRTYPSSSSSEHSQCQTQKQLSTSKGFSSIRSTHLDYSISQHSQSQYF